MNSFLVSSPLDSLLLDFISGKYPNLICLEPLHTGVLVPLGPGDNVNSVLSSARRMLNFRGISSSPTAAMFPPWGDSSDSALPIPPPLSKHCLYCLGSHLCFHFLLDSLTTSTPHHPSPPHTSVIYYHRLIRWEVNLSFIQLLTPQNNEFIHSKKYNVVIIIILITNLYWTFLVSQDNHFIYAVYLNSHKNGIS